MTHQSADEIVHRFTLAAADLLRHPLDPGFADDVAFAVFLAGPPLDGTEADDVSQAAETAGMDLIHLSFEPGRERFGPTGVGVFGMRRGAMFRWTDCVLWAPRNGGPLLIVPLGLNACFAHDGKAMLSFPSGPKVALGAGIKRARGRLRRSAWSMMTDQLRGRAAERPSLRAPGLSIQSEVMPLARHD